MGEIDTDQEYLSDMTVGDFLLVIADLDPALKLIDAYADVSRKLQQLEVRTEGRERLLEQITRERDACSTRCQAVQKEYLKEQERNKHLEYRITQLEKIKAG